MNGIESSRRNGVKRETYKIANLCAQFTETVSIPTRCTGDRWRYCLHSRERETESSPCRKLERSEGCTHLKAQCQICGLDPCVVHSRRRGNGLARSASVKRDDVVCRVESGVVHLIPQPGRIQIERVEHHNRRFVGVEGVDGPEPRTGCVPYGDRIGWMEQIDVRHSEEVVGYREEVY